MANLERKISDLEGEGKFVVLKFEADYTEENGGPGLTVFRVKEGKLTEVYNPVDFDVWGCMPGDHEQRVLDVLRKCGATRIYSFDAFFAPDTFLGHRLRSNHRDGWYRYEGLDDHYHAPLFSKAGMELEIIYTSDFGGQNVD